MIEVAEKIRLTVAMAAKAVGRHSFGQRRPVVASLAAFLGITASLRHVSE